MIRKQVSRKGRSVRVTFELPSEIASERIAVAGDFNDWDTENHSMRLDEKRGVWKTSISFKPGESHEFRYFVDGRTWCNDETADGYAPNPYFSENCILSL